MNKTTLIPVFTGTLQNQSVHLCNARDLHVYLQIGKDFTNWIKDRIQQYGFIEGEDFCSPNLASKDCSPNSGSNRKGRGGHNRTDYHLTLDTAKELSMVENNEQGRMARRYFIDQEKKALSQLGQAQPAAEPPALPNHKHITPAQAEEISTLMCVLFPERLDRHSAWRRFKANFKINSYRRLPASRFDEAITFIESTDARRRNEFGSEGGQGSLASRNIGPQIDLDTLSRLVAERLMAGQRGEDSGTDSGIDQACLVEIETRLAETIAKFNFIPNSSIFQNLHSVLHLVKNAIKNCDTSKGGRDTGARYLDAPQPSPLSDLVQHMRESDLPCVEIGLYEIEAAAGCEAGQIRAGDIAAITAEALLRRPELRADIQLVSGWLAAEAHCTGAQRDAVRRHWMGVARATEDALSS